LAALRETKAEDIPLPEVDFRNKDEPALEKFVDVAESSGIQILDSEDISLQDLLNELRKKKKIQTSLGSHKKQFPVLLEETDPYNKENAPDLFVCEGHFGVAENAAIWLDDAVLPSRILAFLPEELIIILSKGDIVTDMHQAYKIVQERDYTYGLFIAGPSKTADIEQTLITGAQGAKNLKVLLID